MRFTPWAIASLAATGWIAGCATVVDPPPTEPRVPLVEALLVAGTTEPTLRLRWAGQIGQVPEPVAPAEAILTLTADPGSSAPVSPVDPSAGLYRAAVPIVAGRAYRLAGTIGGRAISARTTVPANLTVLAPTGPIASSVPAERFAFRWRSVGASAYSVDHAVFVSTRGRQTRDTIGEFILAPDGAALPSELTIYALNADAERYLFFAASAQGNVTGGIGVLGAAITVRRPLQWP
ncbi:MAG: hypothetical protein ACKVZ0_08330 [Gemmatimonadales bacterium]